MSKPRKSNSNAICPIKCALGENVYVKALPVGSDSSGSLLWMFHWKDKENPERTKWSNNQPDLNDRQLSKLACWLLEPGNPGNPIR